MDPNHSDRREAAPPIARDTTVVASPNQVSTSIGDEAVILGADAGQYFGLSEVGARIWELVQAPRQVSEVCAVLCDEYDVAPDACERDVLALLTELRDRGLIDVGAGSGPR